MFELDGNRITDPAALSTIEIVEAAEKCGQLVVQFSRPGSYPPPVLRALNEACVVLGERVQVRFFGHDRSAFDATALRNLPDVSDLAADCLADIVHEDEIGRLPNLRNLHFGVFNLDRPDVLATMGMSRLKRLSVSENRKRNIDLSPLARADLLEDLFIQGHAKGASSIAGIPRLRKLTLSAYAKSHPLDFVGSLPALKYLTLILGGREEIDLSSESLEMLQVIRVRGLTTLGDLSRFPRLSALRIEDQLRLGRLDLGGANLERLWLFNCKTLAELTGLDAQQRLKEFRASGVALDLSLLRDRAWPSATRTVHLFSNSQKWNDDAQAKLAARGLNESGELWP